MEQGAVLGAGNTKLALASNTPSLQSTNQSSEFQVMMVTLTRWGRWDFQWAEPVGAEEEGGAREERYVFGGEGCWVRSVCQHTWREAH